MSDLTQPVRRLGHGDQKHYSAVLAECRSPLWTAESLVENSLQFGKVQNLRKACQRLHLVEIPAGEVFSFWKQVGIATRSTGYVRGRELRQGCLIPTLGGGLCQLSNSLYDVALQTSCEIVERHAHSAVVPGSAAEQGRDATIFWNYVDLRFRPAQNTLITVALTHDELIVRFWGKQRLVSIHKQPQAWRESAAIHTCTDCGVSECFRHIPADTSRSAERNAFLIDECWPEFEEFAQIKKSNADDLFLPYHSNLKKISRYAWNTGGYRRTLAANAPTLLAAAKSRLRLNGDLPPVAVQVARAEELANYYGERLAIDASHLYVAQSLLPFLWRRGDLGGRTFDVLMTRLPLQALHQQLDDLADRFPERKSFKEFRAPEWMVTAESDALERANQIITPHSALANLFPLKTTWLQWKFPLTRQAGHGSCVVFPGPALARKGAFELRQALDGLGCQLRILSVQAMESKDLWDGIELAEPFDDWLEQASVVVQPAFVENNPRPLLRALAAGIPVIATPECGICAHPLLTLVPAGDPAALRKAFCRIVNSRNPENFTYAAAPL